MTDIFADAFKSILSALETAGDPDVVRATYQPATGDPIPDIQIHIDKSIDLQPAGFDSRVVGQTITIEAVLADLGKEPDRGETFTTEAGVVYTVLSIVENDGHTVKAAVK